MKENPNLDFQKKTFHRKTSKYTKIFIIATNKKYKANNCLLIMYQKNISIRKK